MPKKIISAIVMTFVIAVSPLCGITNFVHATENETLDILSVSHEGMELSSHFDEEVNANYYEIPRTQSSVDIEVKVNNLKANKTYRISSLNRDFTSEDNGKNIVVSATPNTGWGYMTEHGYASYIQPYLYTQEPYVQVTSAQTLLFKSDEVGTDNISIVSISQNDINLQQNANGAYDVPDYMAPVSVTYKLENLKSGQQYLSYAYINGGSQNTESRIATSDTEILSQNNLYINGIDNYNHLSISFYSSPLDGQYISDYFSIELNVTDPSYMPLGDFYVSRVEQNGAEITPTCDEYNCSFALNDVKSYTLYFYTNQAIDNKTYEIYSNNNYDLSNDILTFSGADLKTGTSLTSIGFSPYSSSSARSSINIKMGEHNSSSRQLFYVQGQDKLPATLQFFEDENIPRLFESRLKYANYEDKDVLDTTVDFRYHNQDNPLSLYIHGKYFVAENNYNFTVNISSNSINGEENVFSKQYTKSGNELNEGTSVLLDGFLMEFMNESDLVLDWNMYKIDIVYDDQTLSLSYDYGCEGIGYGINSTIVDNNDRTKVLTIVGGAGGPRTSMAATMSDNMYVYFYVNNLPENETFTYSIKKSTTDSIAEATEVANGILSSSEIENGKIAIPVEYDTWYYIFIKKDDNIIAWQKNRFYYDDAASGIDKIGVSVGEAPVKLNFDPLAYFVVKNGSDVSVNLHGKNLNEQEQYNVAMSLSLADLPTVPESGGMGTLLTTTNKTFTGKELNDGTAVIDIPYSEEFNTNTPIVNGLFRTMSASFTLNGQMFGNDIRFKYVNPEFSMQLNGDDTFINETALYLSVDDYRFLSEECDGIAGVIGDLEYDRDKLELISTEALNNFEAVIGDHFVLHEKDGKGVLPGTNILKITFRNKGLARGEQTTVSFKNIIGSDGENNISAADATKVISLDNATAAIEDTSYIIAGSVITKVAAKTTTKDFVEQFELSNGATLRLKDSNDIDMAESDIVGTGAKVQLLNAYDEVVNEYTIVIKGDISGDGNITITDLVKAKRYLAGLDTLSGVYLNAGDIINTGNISITDVVKICRHIAGLGVIG